MKITYAQTNCYYLPTEKWRVAETIISTCGASISVMEFRFLRPVIRDARKRREK